MCVSFSNIQNTIDFHQIASLDDSSLTQQICRPKSRFNSLKIHILYLAYMTVSVEHIWQFHFHE